MKKPALIIKFLSILWIWFLITRLCVVFLILSCLERVGVGKQRKEKQPEFKEQYTTEVLAEDKGYLPEPRLNEMPDELIDEINYKIDLLNDIIENEDWNTNYYPDAMGNALALWGGITHQAKNFTIPNPSLKESFNEQIREITLNIQDRINTVQDARTRMHALIDDLTEASLVDYEFADNAYLKKKITYMQMGFEYFFPPDK